MKIRIYALSILYILIVLSLSGCGIESEDASNGTPNIILILIDTIRADHLSVNGYYRTTTPVLDSLASKGAIWSRVQGQSSWTLPAMTSIMTGLSQRSHRAGWSARSFYGIDPALPTLPLLLSRAGYQTAAFFNVIFMNEDFGFHRGFDHFDCQGFVGDASIRNAAETVDDFLNWFDTDRDTTKPLFVAIHFFDPHLPYSPPSPWDTLYSIKGYDGLFNSTWGGRDEVLQVNEGRVAIDSIGLENLIGLYDGELAFTDNQTGRMLSELESRGILENAIIIVIGDHGEEFLDHGGLGHGHTLYQELLDIPLIMTGPKVPEGVRFDELAAQVDILPSILNMCNLSIPEWSEGRNLLETGSLNTVRTVPSSNLVWAVPDLASVRLGNEIIIGNPQVDNPVQYDLSMDPDEHNPLLPTTEMVDYLYSYWSLPVKGHPEMVPFIDSMERALRDLGYIR